MAKTSDLDDRLEEEEMRDPEFWQIWEETSPQASFGLALGYMREQHGMTQQRLADATGIQRSVIARLENGEGDYVFRVRELPPSPAPPPAMRGRGASPRRPSQCLRVTARIWDQSPLPACGRRGKGWGPPRYFPSAHSSSAMRTSMPLWAWRK